MIEVTVDSTAPFYDGVTVEHFTRKGRATVCSVRQVDHAAAKVLLDTCYRESWLRWRRRLFREWRRAKRQQLAIWILP